MPKKPGGAAPAASPPARNNGTRPAPRRTEEAPIGGPGDPGNDLDGDARAESHAPLVDTRGLEEAMGVAPEDEEIVGVTEEDDYLRALWWGPQGTGKTTAVAKILESEPEGKLLICNAEAGVKARALRRHGIPMDRIAVWPKPGVRPTFDGLERLVLRVDAEMAEARRTGNPKPYCAFAMDSVTELVKLMLDNIAEELVTRQREQDQKARAQGVAPPRRAVSRGRFKAERDDYQLVSGQMRSLLRKLRYMDLHFLATALVRRDEDQDTGKVTYGPAMPPALQADLMGYMDLVIRTELTNAGEFLGHTRPDESNMAKERYGILPAELENPSADRVFAILNDESVIDSVSPSYTTEEDAPAPAEEAPEEPAAEKPKRATRSRKKVEPEPAPADADDDRPPY